MRHTLVRLLFLSLMATLAACATVPETGRSQLMLISPAQEREMGQREFRRMVEELPVERGTERASLVEDVGERIAAVAPLPDAEWEFVLFDQPETANAFCLPGGKVGIYTGILGVTEDEAGLATVMAHEVAHAVARHGGERLSRAMALDLGATVVAGALGSEGPGTREALLGAYSIGAQVGVMLPHSRANELEADRLGLIYMARAGYDPRAAVAFWERFQAAKGEGGAPPVFLSTHPPDAQRIRALRKQLPHALEIYRSVGGQV
ncbi:Peptidase family M48 [Thiohalospira halophila DSM 15071]|uniref:Peptidase family M48 n=1 Tax=Thiohalospira halophila DSM 15071 TaxID=1123397 RepID=A0A1I1UZZ8_9GAMM|nr:M48 family metallopeptidase [Thiohalospira halophila]SFD76371.1 Peptidase family M48 [Thiohalospira halophila DSM 15071]